MSITLWNPIGTIISKVIFDSSVGNEMREYAVKPKYFHMENDKANEIIETKNIIMLGLLSIWIPKFYIATG
ncbi:hypothetical protein CS537_19755 [Yersinia mollaretii]|nr:hypothetical protein CS537_19755 [Yersinia mollaretii]